MSNPSLTNVVQYVRVSRGTPELDFVLDNPEPVLVFQPFNSMDDSRVDTLAGLTREDMVLEGAMITVGVVRKRPGANSFGMMITVGRASNNDIVVPVQGVSKFHAYFIARPGAAVSLTDAGSTNGTHVAGTKLDRNRKVDLSPGARLTLGTVDCAFHSPQTFYQLLLQLRDDPNGAFS